MPLLVSPRVICNFLLTWTSGQNISGNICFPTIKPDVSTQPQIEFFFFMALILCKQGIKENNTATGERVFLHDSNIQLIYHLYITGKLREKLSLWSKLITSNMSQYHPPPPWKKINATKNWKLLKPQNRKY